MKEETRKKLALIMSEFGVNEIIFGQGTENEKSFMNKVLQLLQDRDS